MTDAKNGFKVLPHGSIEVLSDNLWRVEGELPNIPIRRVMTLVRLSTGDVLIHNAIMLEDDLMHRIEAWGRPTWLVVPNGGHRMDAPAMKASSRCARRKERPSCSTMRSSTCRRSRASRASS